MSCKSITRGVFLAVAFGIFIYSADAGIWTDPNSFNVNVTEGCTLADILTIGNDGVADINFTVRTRVVGGGGGASEGIERLSAASRPVVSPMGAGLNFNVQSNVPHKPDELIVRFAPDTSGSQLTLKEKHSKLSTLAGAKVKREFKLVPGLSVVKLPAGMTVEKAVQRLSKVNGILYAHPNYEVQALSTFPNDPRFNELWGMHNTGQTGGTPDADIDAPEAWDIGTGSRGIVVAVIDTGVDYTHPDLAANMWVNQAEYSGTPGVDDDGNGFVDDIYGYDFVNNDGDPWDDHGHGTHCSGTIGGIGNNGVGVAGVCWKVKIMAVKFLNSGGSGSTEDAIQSVEYSVLMGAHLSSNSWGGGGYSQGLKDAIDAAGVAGMLFVAAAGNDYGNNNDTNPHYPSSYDSPSLIAVMATDYTDQMSSFSNYGPTSVDIGAPGSSILSCLPGSGYGVKSGTSMATPHVAGACALLWSMNPDLSNSEVKDILLSTVDPTLSGLCVSGGRLNLYKAVCETKVPWLTIEPEEGTIGPGQFTDLDVTFDALELTPGVYGAEIVIVSNDSNNPQKAVPVTMTVEQDDLTVTPAGGFDSNGTKGGPFEPACKKYTLTNNGSEPVNWTTLPTGDWLTVTPSAGVLEPSASIDVNVSISPNADLLDPNVYSEVLTFQNLDSGSIKLRSVTLTVNPPDLFTESFDAGGNFAGISLTFRPNGTIACYEACRDEVNEFPTDPNGGTYLSLGDDDYAQVVLTGGQEVMFYNQSYDRFYVGSNGYITFGAGDTEFEGSLENHFNMPRISGYFTDLTPATSQNISYRQLEDRVAITFLDVPIFGDKTAKNSFQIEIFFGDGSICITWLKTAAAAGTAGLSEGYGLPPELFRESNFRAYPICWPLGDFNKDYTVDLFDLGIFVSYWLYEDCNYPMWCGRADLDFSSIVEGVDFSIFAWGWGVVKSTMPSPVSHWKFDEGEGTVAYDSVGDNDGNLMNGPVWTTGQINGGLSFDGVNDYVIVPNNDSQQIKTNQITLSAWIKLAADVGNTQRRVICKQQTAYIAWGFEVFGVGYGGASGNQVVFHDTDGGSHDHVCVSPAHLSLNQWYHIAVTDDAGAIRIYIDGQLNRSDDNGYGIPSQISAPMMMGSMNPYFFFNGTIDDVRFYDTALTAEEIEQLYREGLSKKATNPNPADGQTGVDPNVVLGWSPGKDALTHDVYFGTDFDEVNEADIYDPNVYMGNYDVNYWDVRNYDSNGLEPNTAFYWRIDEVRASETTKGDVWSFRTAIVPGLVSWWKFDEGTGTIAHDSVGDNDGAIYGAIWTTGQIGGALDFDGVNDYVEIEDDDSLRLTANYTLSLWIYRYTYTATHERLIAKSQSQSQNAYDYWFQISNETLEAGITSNSSLPSYLSGSTIIETCKWYFIVTTYDGRGFKMYVNGTLTDEGLTVGSGGDARQSDKNLQIGRLNYNGIWYYSFNGKMDDIRIYDRILSQDEVEQLYREGLSKKATNPNPADGQTGVDPNVVLGWSPGKDALTHDVYFGTDFDEVNEADIYDPNVYMGNYDVNYWDVRNYDPNGLEPYTMFYWRIDEVSSTITAKGDVWSFRTAIVPGLVGWWKFDEGTGTTAYDSAGDRNGAVNGASWTTGKIEGALNFDGVNDYVELPNNTPVWLPQDDFTASAWVYFDTDPASRPHDFILGLDFTYYENHTSCTGIAFFRNGNDGKAILQIETTNTTDSLYSNTVLARGRWYHVVAVRQATTQAIYLDGSLNASRSCSPDPIKYSGTCNDDKVNIGRASEACWTNQPYYLDGKIDDVRIYNKALSAEEILELYREGQSKKAYNPYPPYGAGGVDPNVVLSWSPGRDALTHDVYFGTDYNEVDGGDPCVYMGNYDVNYWDVTGYDPNGLEPYTMFYWRIDEVGAAETTKGDVWVFTTAPALPGKASNPVPADASTDVNLNQDLSWTAGSGATSHDVYFGTTVPPIFRGNQTGTTYDTGTMDTNTTYFWRIDEKNAYGITPGDIWTFTTISEEFDPNFVAWWKFDEGTGTVAYDSAGDNDGNLMNGPVWTTGQINGGLSFDGVDDYVTVPNNNSQQIKTNQITLAAWIKLAADVGNTQRRIICKQQNYYNEWTLTIFGSGYGGSSGNQLVFHDSDGVDSYYTCMSPTNVNLARWYHVAVTDDAGAIRIYIDGQLNNSDDNGYGIPSQINAPIMIGSTNPASYFHFNGVIDDVRLYNRALSAEDVNQIYQDGL